MNKLILFFQKHATLRNAFLAYVLLEISVKVLHRLDMPLKTLTPAERKLDFHSHYDVSTVIQILTAYGPPDRTLHA
jgi:hypothetical protein